MMKIVSLSFPQQPSDYGLPGVTQVGSKVSGPTAKPSFKIQQLLDEGQATAGG